MSAQDPSKQLPSEPGEHRTLQLLKKIQSGAIDPKSLGKDVRRPLVEYLMGDGYSTADMAEILKVSNRCIERDRKAIRESNAIPRDPRFVELMVGRLCWEADLCIQRIRKAVRGNDAPEHVKVDAEHRCYQIVSDLVQRLQGLGYLPTASQRIEADLTHYTGDLLAFEELLVEVHRLQRADSSPKLVALEQEIQRACLANQVQDAARTIESEEDDDEQR